MHTQPRVSVRGIHRIRPFVLDRPTLYARLREDCDGFELALSLDVSTAVCSVFDFKPDVHIVENFDRTGRYGRAGGMKPPALILTLSS